MVKDSVSLPQELDQLTCSFCGFTSRIEAKFCGGCARLLQFEPVESVLAERRTLCVLFADIVGSIRLFQAVDPEDLREILANYYQICAAVVRRFDGWIGPLLGDGVIIIFGYPQAHEDEPVRAVHCALAIQQAIQTRALKAAQPFKVRIGLHRGLAVVGDLGGGSGIHQIAIGHAPSMSARLQAEAQPGEVLVSEALWRLVQSSFSGESIGLRCLKGFERPIAIYRVLEFVPQAQPKALAHAFLGRHAEIGSIQALWQRVLLNQPQVVLLRGEAGIGKSRLIQQLVMEFGQDPTIVLEAYCTPFTSDTPFYPLAQLLRSRLGLEGVPPQQQLEILGCRLRELGLDSPEALPLLALVLSIAIDPSQAPLLAALSPKRQRQRTIELLHQALGLVVGAAPLLLVIEDLHWADPSTLAWLDQGIRHPQTSCLLVLLSARPQFRSPWGATAPLSEFTLEGLSAPEAEHLIRYRAANKPLPPELVREIQRRSSGNPFFLEQITCLLIDSNALIERDNAWQLTAPVSAVLLPASIDAALMARIDRLGGAKHLLQFVSILGQEFSKELLLAVAPIESANLEQQLQMMVDEGFLHSPVGAPPVYRFKHALLQNAAYESLLLSTRQRHHAQIASVIAERFPALANRRPELLAHHLSGAGRYAEAASYWQAAGEAAARRRALKEALEHLRRGLADLEQLPQVELRWHSELALLAALAPVQMAVLGWASPLVACSCLRAIDLADRLGADQRRFAPLWGLWSHRFAAGRLGEALQTAEQLLGLALRSDVRIQLLAARHSTSLTRYYRGEYGQALQEAEIGLTLYSIDQDVELHRVYQLSLSIPIMAAKASCLWMLGKQKDGSRLIVQMLDLARTFNHPPSLATGLGYMMFFCFYNQDWAALLAVAEELWQLANFESFDMWRANAGMHRARARLELQGSPQAAEADRGELLESMEFYRQTGSGLLDGSTTCLISEALHGQGRSEQALRESLCGEQRAQQGEGKVLLPEILRTRGTILKDLGRCQEADHAYGRAVAAARSQGALSLQLRALNALLAHRLEHAGARPLLPELQRTLAAVDAVAASPDLPLARHLLAKLAG